jgi:hypothetical protein
MHIRVVREQQQYNVRVATQRGIVQSGLALRMERRIRPYSLLQQKSRYHGMTELTRPSKPIGKLLRWRGRPQRPILGKE